MGKQGRAARSEEGKEVMVGEEEEEEKEECGVMSYGMVSYCMRECITLVAQLLRTFTLAMLEFM